jgi:hypothetical protein
MFDNDPANAIVSSANGVTQQSKIQHNLSIGGTRFAFTVADANKSMRVKATHWTKRKRKWEHDE